MTHAITAAFLPLIDASILIAAREHGFAEEQGIDLVLSQETSWANVRDRIMVGHIDVAHMLAPMPLAANLGLTPLDTKIIAPMALGLGGNAITVSDKFRRVAQLGDGVLSPQQAGSALRDYIQSRPTTRPRIAVVHAYSAHNLELRYWLAASAINPDRDCDIVILPPTLMASALADGKIDGFCVGEPYNSVAVQTGSASILTTKELIWASSPEKVLGVHADWARRHPDLLQALIRSLCDAAQWCGDVANREILAAYLTRREYLNIDSAILMNALSGPAAYEPFGRAATFPWQSHAMWFYSQMARWNMVEPSRTGLETARSTYRPDLYRAALRETKAILPTSSMKVEGALTKPQTVAATGGELVLGPDGFFDAMVFDPDRTNDYIEMQSKLPL